MKRILLSLLTLSVFSTAQAKPIEPVKVDNADQYNYIYLMYLKSDNGSYIPLPMDHGKPEDTKARCKQNDHIRSLKAFVLLNKEFALPKDLDFSLKDKIVQNNLNVVGSKCD